MDIGSSALSGALNYGIIPTPKTLIKIADYFNLSPNYLQGRSDFKD